MYYPLNHKNPYVAIVTEAIKNAGYEVYDLEDIKKNHKRFIDEAVVEGGVL